MVKIVSQDEAEEADFVVCCREGSEAEFRFPDNEYGNCHQCGHRVFYRPHAPKKPLRICMECAASNLAISDDTDELHTTSQAWGEVTKKMN